MNYTQIVSKRKWLGAFGTLLLLAAWLLEWQSVNYWNSAQSDFKASIDSTISRLALTKLSAQIRHEGAVSRAVRDHPLDPKNSSHSSDLAWEYAEVRSVWAHGTIELTKVLLFQDALIRDVAKHYGLSLKTDLTAVAKQTADVKKLMLDSLDEPSRKKATGPVLSSSKVGDYVQLLNETSADLQVVREKLSPSDAISLGAKLTNLQQSLNVPINEINTAMKEQSERSSTPFRIAFALGSLLVVAAGFLDAWHENKQEKLSKVKRGRGL